MPKEVIIDGVRYVPATEALVNGDVFLKTLLAQYWGTPVDQRAIDYIPQLRILVSDGISVDEGESFEAFTARLAQSLKQESGPTKKELMQKSIEELREELNAGFAKDAAFYANLGALGVSPRHLLMYEATGLAIKEQTNKSEETDND